MPVAWDKSNVVPDTYEFILPIDMTVNQTAFTDKYKSDCVDWSAHDVTSSSMWYYYRPEVCMQDRRRRRLSNDGNSRSKRSSNRG